MDHNSLAGAIQVATLCVVIVAAGFYEYRRREGAHRLKLAILRRGEIPPDVGRPRPALRLLSLGSVCLIYAACLGGLEFMAASNGLHYSRPIHTIAAALSPPLVFLLLMFIRDLRRLRRRRQEEA